MFLSKLSSIFLITNKVAIIKETLIIPIIALEKLPKRTLTPYLQQNKIKVDVHLLPDYNKLMDNLKFLFLSQSYNLLLLQKFSI